MLFRIMAYVASRGCCHTGNCIRTISPVRRAVVIVGGEQCAAKCSWMTQEQSRATFALAQYATKLQHARNRE